MEFCHFRGKDISHLAFDGADFHRVGESHLQGNQGHHQLQKVLIIQLIRFLKGNHGQGEGQ